MKFAKVSSSKVIVNGICRLTFCQDCGVEEPVSYMVENSVWKEAGFRRYTDGIICMNCLSVRLERPLTHKDLNWSDLNKKFSKPILFVDIDGVLNNHEAHPRTRYCTIDKNHAKHFDNLLLQLDASFVLTSSWRYLSDFMNLKGMRNLFHTHWIDGERLIGWTRKDAGKVTDRGLQIKEWLEQHSLFGRYAVIDNIDLDITTYNHPYVQTDWGLNERACEEILRLILGQ